jgi:hypothetical protein
VKTAHGFHEEKVAGELKAVNDNNNKKKRLSDLVVVSENHKRFEENC